LTSLNRCKEKSKEFILHALPIIQPEICHIPTLPSFRQEFVSKTKRYRFIEEKQTNWWQLPKVLRQTLLGSEVGRALSCLLETTPPFSKSIGKRIELPELGQSSLFHSGSDIARVILVSYLFFANKRRWDQKSFEAVWKDCLSYFNPNITSVEYCLYAPIAFMSGVRRRLDLGDGLSIRRLPAHKIASLASLDQNLAGVFVDDLRLTKWPVCFFEKRLNFKKRLSKRDEFDFTLERATLKWVSHLNEETVMLRCFLNKTLAVPTFSFIRYGSPRVFGGGHMLEMPWRGRLTVENKHPSIKEVRKYKIRRAKFLTLHGSPGWESVAASMRRFSIAWENQFRVDILADIVAALEHLVVRSNEEVSYKLRTRTSQFLAKSPYERQIILENLKDAYSYRSKTFHGGFVFDNASDILSAKRLKGTKGKQGNPFHDVNEVHRLIHIVAGYYQRILETIIDQGKFEINWEAKGL